MSDVEIAIEPDLTAGARVEWRDGTQGDINCGTLIQPDDGLGGPWWLVDVDGETSRSLVKTYALYPAGGIRRERMADEIHRAMRILARKRGEPGYPSWSDALRCADAVIALEASTL